MQNKKILKMIKMIWMIFSLVMCLVISVLVLAVDKPVKFYLNDIKFENEAVKITTSGQVKYNIFKISNPARLVIDLLNTEHALRQKEYKVSSDIVKRIRSGQNRISPTKITRVVIDLVKMVDYEVKQKDNTLIINMIPIPESEPKEAVTPTAQKLLEAFAPTTIPPSTEVSIVPTTVVTTAPTTGVIPSPAKVTTPLPRHVAEPVPTQVVQPAVTPSTVTPTTKPAPATVTPQVVTQPKTVPITKPVTVAKKPVIEKPKKAMITMPKTLVTFDFVDADIRDVLQVMSIRSGINIIYGPDVTGPPEKPVTITISLRDVPFDQAFNTILSLKGLTTIPVAENTIRVITPAQLTKERAEGVTFTKVFPLNYAKPSEIKAQLDAVRAAEGRKGSITVDERTNSLIVTETQEGLISTEKLIAELDKKPLQVSIEAKLVDITLSDLLELGVNWSGTQLETVSGGGLTVKGGDITAGPLKVTKPDVSGVKEAKGIGAEVAGTIPGTGGIFNFGVITDNLTLGAKLAALASEGRLKVLASPKVTTINNKEAKILIGEKVPYKTTTVTPGPSPVITETWQYIDAGVKLTVTPTINPDKVITLKVKPEVSVPAPAVPGAAPSVRSREADVTVMIKDNDTLVIGGLIREEDIRDIQKVPLLGDLPILGYLFKYRKDTKTRTELAVFLTPKIVPD